MANMILTLPIITGLVGSLAAFLYGVSSLKFRLSITRLSWILALAPLSAFSILLILLPGLSGGQAIAQRFTWLPTFNLDAWLYLDSLSALFALLTAVAVATAGVIAFVALMVPSLARGWVGQSHRAVVLGSALLGATLLVVADVLARSLFSPVELSIGIITTIVGAPFFLWLLLRERGLLAR